LDDVFHRVTMQVFVRDHFPMIAAPVQCDVDGISKGSHSVSVSPIKVGLGTTSNEAQGPFDADGKRGHFRAGVKMWPAGAVRASLLSEEPGERERA
jgi:hypothetical protein